MTPDERQQACLETLGITRWVRKDLPEPPQAEIESAPAAAEATVQEVAEMAWPALEAAIRGCRRCDLHTARKHAVVGVGDTQADWMIIGEAPGEQEDLQGEPFVGRAGVLLNNMLAAAGLSRETVYIANVIKCRPPGNRDPNAEEIASCIRYLERQIALIRPRLILIVGRVAAQTLLQTDSPVGRMRGRVHYYGESEIPVVVTYHPAYLLRRPGEKALSWDDLKLALAQQHKPST